MLVARALATPRPLVLSPLVSPLVAAAPRPRSTRLAGAPSGPPPATTRPLSTTTRSTLLIGRKRYHPIGPPDVRLKLRLRKDGFPVRQFRRPAFVQPSLARSHRAETLAYRAEKKVKLRKIEDMLEKWHLGH